jgi:hypothetical protein
VTLLETILGEYLGIDQVKILAREHGLPVSRTKDQLVGELIAADEVTNEEVVAFLQVWQLQMICEELGLPSGADQDTLAARVIEALEEERRPKPGRQRPKRASVPPADALPNAPPEPVKVQQINPPSSAWGFAAVVVAIVAIGGFEIATAELGVIRGAVVATVVGLIGAVILLFTYRLWGPPIDRFVHGGGSTASPP